jgi:hypothetical protein
MRFDTSWAGQAVDLFGGFMQSLCINELTRHTKITWKPAYLFLLRSSFRVTNSFRDRPSVVAKFKVL